jgi:phosphomannomutase
VEAYLDAIAQLSIHEPCPERAGLRVTYTPLHGVGWPVAQRALERAGFSSVDVVATQRDPDPDFSTVAFPNPEEAGAMDAAFALARETRADVIIANDPDADRLSVGVPDGTGRYRLLTGDQVGVLLGADRIAGAPPRSVVATTIVSSRMLSAVARAHGVGFFETLTGFKWIAAGGFAHEARGEKLLFGYEEALGYTIGDVVRDKDGISAMIAFLELAADCARRGTTILEQLELLYRQHGLYLTRQQSIALDPDRQGPTVGERLRRDPPRSIAGRDVLSVADMQAGTRRTKGGGEEALDLPQSDVLTFLLDDDARVVVRPSGTEPKLKCYYEVCERVGARESFRAAEDRATEALDGLVSGHQAEIAALSDQA